MGTTEFEEYMELKLTRGLYEFMLTLDTISEKQKTTIYRAMNGMTNKVVHIIPNEYL
jgi:hypothetical protein